MTFPSQNPTIAPMPVGISTPLTALAQRFGFGLDVHGLVTAARDGDLPALPPQFLLGGSLHVDTGLARIWILDAERHQLVAGDRAAAKAERERQAREDAVSARQQADAIKMNWGREQAAMFEENARLKQQRLDADAAKARGQR